MANLLSLPHEILRLILEYVPHWQIHRAPTIAHSLRYGDFLLMLTVRTGFATICSQILPVVRERLYSKVAMTERNLPALLRTSRQLAYSNLRSARTVQLGNDWEHSGTLDEALVDEAATHLQPVKLYLHHSISEASLDRIGVQNLTRLEGSFDRVGRITQRASATLQNLRTELPYNRITSTCPGDFPPMVALRYLDLEDNSVDSATLHEGFSRFLRSCVSLSSLHLQVESAPHVEAILSICGSTLTELQIFGFFVHPSPTLSTSLAALTSQLRTLRLISIAPIFLMPYPTTLQKLEFCSVSVGTAASVLSALKARGTLPNISHLYLEFDEDDEERLGEEAENVMAEISLECRKQSITFECEFHYKYYF